MKAIVLKQTGGIENLTIQEIEKPGIHSSEVLIEVKAISVNPVEFKARSNDDILNIVYGEQRPVILGWDIAGVVVEVGNQATQFQVGDRVFGLVNFFGAGKGYAEYVAAPASHLAKIPENTSFEAAAASTLAALTALQVLQNKVKKGDQVLIHAGSGGVGHFAIQIAKSLGAYVTTTSSAKNKAFVLSLGADQHIDYTTVAFEEVLSGIDFTLDMFHGDILLNSIKVMKEGGTIVSLAAPIPSEEIQNLAKKRNVALDFYMVQSNGNDMNIIKEMLENSTLKPHVSQTFDFTDMAQAHKKLESDRTVGKIVVVFN